MRRLITLLVLTASFVAGLSISPVLATPTAPGGSGLETILKGPDSTFGDFNTKFDSGVSEQSLPNAIFRIINVILGVLGVVMTLLFLYAGFLWMNARGESDPVEQAQEIFKQATVGSALILAAWIISWFVLTQLLRAVSSPGQ